MSLRDIDMRGDPYDYMDDNEVPDIDGTLEAIGLAWHATPEMQLDELLDTVCPAPMVELSNSELIDLLRDYAHQYGKV